MLTIYCTQADTIEGRSTNVKRVGRNSLSKRNLEVIGKFMILRVNGFHVIWVGNVLLLNRNS
jgi:hypothetical protein